jgi:pyruvate dehydrogenase E2 component (dihydrolipoamide acetyltransferase)
MARVEVPMPQMGESIAEGTVSVWLKRLGDRVERDEAIMEISTDKVDAEIPSPAAGLLAEIVVEAGQTVEVGTVVAYIETDVNATLPDASPTSTLPEAAAGQPEIEPATASSASSVSAEAPRSEARAVEEAPAGAAVGASPRDEELTLEGRLRSHSSPLVRRIAAENAVDLREIDGSGRLGRVTKEDVLRYVEERKRAGQRPARDGDGGFDWEDFYTHVEHPKVAARPGDRVEPMSRMTQIVAEHMVLSRRISPHVHSYFEIDYSRVDQLREKNRRLWAEQGVKVSYTAFITSAVATALREHPKVNAAVSGDQVIYRGDINIGIAVALPWGLIVPVVKNADQLSLVGLAHRIADLAERARAKKLSPEEVQGGTFTVTNPGIFGTTIGFAIVNQPQVAILAVGGIEKRPAVITDEFGNDAIVARKRGFLSLGYDHRLVNGADGDQFLARVKQILEGFPDVG